MKCLELISRLVLAIAFAMPGWGALPVCAGERAVSAAAGCCGGEGGESCCEGECPCVAEAPADEGVPERQSVPPERRGDGDRATAVAFEHTAWPDADGGSAVVLPVDDVCQGVLYACGRDRLARFCVLRT